ncbi:Cupredoxin [Phlegmacium glaucopus]|nr:Cupredoxin [Phlegmacium glaucopus]
MRSSFVIATLLSAAACVVNAANTMVMVGSNGTLTFSPNSITAAVGDTVTFQFQAKNHTATQSTFAAPCSRMASGVNSGFNPVSATATQLPQFTIMVNATTPMWFYCAQKNPVSHCAMGMVFAINAPTSGNTFEAFQVSK